jgi:energy-coupling factor transporter ATPase
MSDVSFQYPGGPLVLRSISLRIQRGEFVAIVGRNGSGKSTLCRLMNGLLLPSSGTVLVEGVDTRLPGTELFVRATVAMVFQIPDNQIVATVVEEDVAFGPENLGLSLPELRERVRAALEAVGLWEKRSWPPHFLSEAEKHRLVLAGALALRPRYLVLDETTAMLDQSGRNQVFNIIREVHKQGTAVVLVTHDMREAREAERVIALGAGTVAYDGPPSELFAAAELPEQLGLLPPPATRLARELHRRISAIPPHLLWPQELAVAIWSAIDGRRRS